MTMDVKSKAIRTGHRTNPPIKDGSSHTNKPAGGNYDEGTLPGFGSNKGARNKRTLRNDAGGEGGKFIDDFDGATKGGDGGGKLRKLKPSMSY